MDNEIEDYNTKIDSSIWHLVNEIQLLESTKDKIIKSMNIYPNSDNQLYNLGIIGIKEAYFNVVAAWEMLRACQQRDPDEINNTVDATKTCIDLARNRFDQSGMILDHFPDAISEQAKTEWFQSFCRCESLIRQGLNHF